MVQPPYSANVTTNIGKLFFRFLNTEFPPSSKLHKIFNKNTIKLSYSCCPNVNNIISKHNKVTLSTDKNIQTTCNCRTNTVCPLQGRCLTKSSVYQATVTTTNITKPAQNYIGLSETTFKERYSNHKCSFQNSTKRNNTELSKYIWQLKDANINFDINWKILKTVPAYQPGAKHCNLCLWEKFYIVYHPNMATLNTRNELVSACRHKRKYILGHIT